MRSPTGLDLGSSKASRDTVRSVGLCQGDLGLLLCGDRRGEVQRGVQRRETREEGDNKVQKNERKQGGRDTGQGRLRAGASGTTSNHRQHVVPHTTLPAILCYPHLVPPEMPHSPPREVPGTPGQRPAPPQSCPHVSTLSTAAAAGGRTGRAAPLGSVLLGGDRRGRVKWHTRRPSAQA